MPTDLVTAAAIVAGSGAGTWLADKLLGPSFDALGRQLQAYAGDRLSKIFASAEKKVDKDSVKALPPAFAIEFTRKASISEDDENLTEMWSSLLADASQGYSSRHLLFVDILSQLGPLEAQLLATAGFDTWHESATILSFAEDRFAASLHSYSFEEAVHDRNYGLALAKEMVDEIRVPGCIIRSLGFSLAGGSLDFLCSSDSFDELSFQILKRQNLMQTDQFEAQPIVAAPKFVVKAEVAKFTSLGLKFYEACEG